MAKLDMQKIELIGLLTDSKKIIELLQRRGVAELTSPQTQELITTNTSSVILEFKKFRDTALKAIEILNEYAPEKNSLSNTFFPKKMEIEIHEFGKKSEHLESILRTASEILKYSSRISNLKSQHSQNLIRIDTLKTWQNLDVPLNFSGTSSTKAIIGVIPAAINQNELTKLLPSECCIQVIYSSKIQTNIFILCTNDAFDEVDEKLRQLAFSPFREPSAKTPAELALELTDESTKLLSEIESISKKIQKLGSSRKSLEFIIDYLGMRIDKYEALKSLSFTKDTFVLNGYIPKKYAQKIIDEILSKYTAAVTLTSPDSSDDVPVLLENCRFSEPLESITEMYSLPGKEDIDPTPVMSFFYYLFFGMMLSDAGYGLVMVIFTTIILKKFKPEDKMRKTMVMFRNCGVSTVIFGALFGSWFGDIVQVVGREFFGKEIGSLALWFEPIDNPIKLLLWSFALGIAHLFLGLAVSFKMSWKAGNKADAVFDTVPIYMIVLGICPAGAGILTDVSGTLKTAGLYLAAAGAVFLILTAGRNSKSIFGKFFGGLYSLYNTATGYLSDILSYSRLLALGLATGSIAGVINLIGTMPENTAVKAVLLIIVFIIGHTANMAVNLLGAYVHSDRLQFVELFSKFYEGGGRAFSPLTIKTNFIKLKEELSNE